MEDSKIKKKANRVKRAQRIRARIKQDTSRVRLSVAKSLTHLSVQLIDDERGVTVAGISTYSKEFRGTEFGHKSKKSAEALGRWIGEKAKALGISEVVLDRGPYKYHGVVAALADAARGQGLQF